MASILQGEQRRALIIAGAGFGLVVVLFFGSRLLAGDGDGGAESTQPPTPPTSAPGQSGAGSGGGSAAGGAGDGQAVPVVPIPDLPDAFEIRELRDPFTPPIQQILNQIGTSPSDSPGDPGGGGGGGGGGGTEPGGSGPQARMDLRSVETDGDGNPFAVVAVDGSVFEAAEGETFGPNDEFLVVSLDVEEQCGLFLFADEPFTECVDESIPQK